MNCEDFENLLADALGNELAATERPRFEAHLAECDRCRREYETSLRTIAAMRALPGPRQVHIERQGTRLILQDSAAPAPPRRRLGGGMLRYAASVLIAFVSGYALHTGLMIAELGKDDSLIVRPPQVTSSDPSSESLQNALVAAHQLDPGRSNLAKCMIAMFPPRP